MRAPTTESFPKLIAMTYFHVQDLKKPKKARPKVAAAQDESKVLVDSRLTLTLHVQVCLQPTMHIEKEVEHVEHLETNAWVAI